MIAIKFFTAIQIQNSDKTISHIAKRENEMDVQTYNKPPTILDEEYSIEDNNINYDTKPNRPSIHVSNHLVIFNESREPEN